MANYNFNIGAPSMTTGVERAYNIGTKLGGAVGNIAGSLMSEATANESQKKIAELMAKYNDPMDVTFGTLSPSQKASKLAQLLLPYDKQQAARYASLGEELAVKERDALSAQKKVAEERAFNKSVFDKMQKPVQEAEAKYNQAKMEWESVGATVDELEAELERATNDLRELENMQAINEFDDSGYKTMEFSPKGSMSPNLNKQIQAPPTPFTSTTEQTYTNPVLNMGNFMDRYK